jgi:hypothetical protein
MMPTNRIEYATPQSPPSNFLIDRTHSLYWHKLFPKFSTASLSLSILNLSISSLNNNYLDLVKVIDIISSIASSSKYSKELDIRNLIIPHLLNYFPFINLSLINKSILPTQDTNYLFSDDLSILNSYVENNNSLDLFSNLNKNVMQTNDINKHMDILTKEISIFNSFLYNPLLTAKEPALMRELYRKSTSYNKYYVNLPTQNNNSDSKKLEKFSLNSLSLLYSFSSSLYVISGKQSSSIVVEE